MNTDSDDITVSVDEIWKPTTFDPEYEVSNLGRVSSVFKGKRRILKVRQVKASKAYFRNMITIRGKTYAVSKMVYEAHIGPVEYELDHINRVSTDDSLSNLRQCDRTGNMTNISEKVSRNEKSDQNCDEKFEMLGMIDGVYFENYGVSRTGKVKNLRTGYILTNVESYEYNKAILVLNKKSYPKYVHRLVALKYIPNPENKIHINHRNGDRKDNDVDNLEWVTRRENQEHAIGKAVFQIDHNCVIINKFPSTTAAVESTTGVYRSSSGSPLGLACRRHGMYKGYRWRFAKEFPDKKIGDTIETLENIEYKKPTDFRILQIDPKDNKVIGIFPTALDVVHHFTGIRKKGGGSPVTSVCKRGLKKTYKDYYFAKKFDYPEADIGDILLK